MLVKAREQNLFNGRKVGKASEEVEMTHFSFADDTLLFYRRSPRDLLNIRCVLLCFQVVSASKINLVKSELVRIRGTREDKELATTLGCRSENLPIKYLGLPLSGKSKEVVWDPKKMFHQTCRQKKHPEITCSLH